MKNDFSHAQEQKSDNENLIDVSSQSDQSEFKLIVRFERKYCFFDLVDENDIQDNGEIIDEESPTKVRRITKTDELNESENNGRLHFN